MLAKSMLDPKDDEWTAQNRRLSARCRLGSGTYFKMSLFHVNLRTSTNGRFSALRFTRRLLTRCWQSPCWTPRTTNGLPKTGDYQRDAVWVLVHTSRCPYSM